MVLPLCDLSEASTQWRQMKLQQAREGQTGCHKFGKCSEMLSPGPCLLPTTPDLEMDILGSSPEGHVAADKNQGTCWNSWLSFSCPITWLSEEGMWVGRRSDTGVHQQTDADTYFWQGRFAYGFRRQEKLRCGGVRFSWAEICRDVGKMWCRHEESRATDPAPRCGQFRMVMCWMLCLASICWEPRQLFGMLEGYFAELRLLQERSSMAVALVCARFGCRLTCQANRIIFGALLPEIRQAAFGHLLSCA